MIALAAILVGVILAVLLFVKNDGETETPLVRWLRRQRDRPRPRPTAPQAQQHEILLEGLLKDDCIHPDTYLAQRLAERRHRDLKRWLAVLGVCVIVAALVIASHLEDAAKADKYERTRLPNGVTIIIDKTTGQRWQRAPSGVLIELPPVGVLPRE